VADTAYASCGDLSLAYQVFGDGRSRSMTCAPTPNIASGLITAGILAGCHKLWQKYHRKAQPQQSAVTSPLSREDLFSKHAGGITAQHYTIGETLTSLNLVITETHSTYEHSGTVDLCERGGRTFQVTISSPNLWLARDSHYPSASGVSALSR
jgi:hypothetical protein